MLKYFLKVYDRTVGKEQLSLMDVPYDYVKLVKGYDEYLIGEGKITFRFKDKEIRDREEETLYQRRPGVCLIRFQGRGDEWQK